MPSKKPTDDDLFAMIHHLKNFHPDAEDYEAAQNVAAFLQATLHRRAIRHGGIELKNAPF